MYTTDIGDIKYIPDNTFWIIQACSKFSNSN